MAKADGMLPKFLHFQTKIKYTEDQNIKVQLENVTDHDWAEVVRCVDCIHAGDRDCPIDWPKNGEDYCSFARGGKAKMPVESEKENNDTISRSETVAILEAEYVRFGDGSEIGKKILPGLRVAIETVSRDVPAIPTVEKRRAARWNHNPNNGFEFICSACCKRTRMVRVIGRVNGQQLTESEKYNFCPRCGAKMENPMPMFKEG